MNDQTSKNEPSSLGHHHPRILTNAELDPVAGGLAAGQHGTFIQAGLGLRKSSGGNTSGSF
jgi:hypothetical protein